MKAKPFNVLNWAESWNFGRYSSGRELGEGALSAPQISKMPLKFCRQIRESAKIKGVPRLLIFRV